MTRPSKAVIHTHHRVDDTAAAVAQLPPITGRAFRGRLRAWAPPAALRPSGPRRRRREPSPRPAAPAGRSNDQRQARELQERAILPALQCEAGQDHAQERFASHVMAYGHPCAGSSPARIGAYRKDGPEWSQ